MLRGCSSRSVTSLLSRVFGGQGACQSTALVAGRQNFRTSVKPPSAQQAIASADGRVCQQHQQQLWKLARQISCSATAAATLPAAQGTENIMLPLQLGFAARFSSSAGQQAAAEKQPAQQQGAKKEAFDSLELTEEKINAITDQIPQRPVTVVEGTSYMVVIIAAFTVLGFFIYNFVTNFVLEPTYQTCFNSTLQRLKQDPRITVRLGNDIVGYGQESASRVQRQQIPHQIYKDNNGVEHVRLQFNMRGPGGVAIVSADMYKDSSGSWDYVYLLVDVQSGRSPPQRLNIVPPKLATVS